MGEISDALKRAKDERESRAPAAAERSTGEFTAALARSLSSDATAGDAHSPASALDPPAREPASALDPPAREPATARPPTRFSRERGGNAAARMVLIDEQGAGAEAYRHFALRTRRALQSRGLHSVMIISALRHEGKTTTACNLSLALASLSAERSTALVDFDLRRPAVADYLGLDMESRAGIEAVLRGEASLAEARIPTEFENLDVYAVASPVSKPHEMLYARRFADTVQQLEKSYDTVVLDSPPVLMAPDVEIMFPHVGACVAVLDSRNTRCGAFKQMIERLPDGKLAGSFINRTRRSSAQYYYGAYTPSSADATGSEDSDSEQP